MNIIRYVRNSSHLIRRIWLARFLIFMVIAWNLQAAIVFLFWPGAYAPGFELTGIPGQAAMRGIGLLFVMWNIPYIIACWHPRQNILSLKETLIMQLIGLLGETAILIALPPQHAVLRTSILRFANYDGVGLAAILLAFWIVTRKEE